jgi:hypothetical protein
MGEAFHSKLPSSSDHRCAASVDICGICRHLWRRQQQQQRTRVKKDDSSVTRLGGISRNLGDNFWRWAHFFLKNISQMISALFISKPSPKIHLNKFSILATFLL